MSQKTTSEDLFEKFCAQNGINWEQIEPTSDEGKKASDYFIYPNNQKIIVEVKQFDPNAEDKEIAKKLKNGKSVFRSISQGTRVRKKISEAEPQLKSLSEDIHPCLLVLFNNTPFTLELTDPQYIKIGMYGIEQIKIAVSPDPDFDPFVNDQGFGPKRKLTPKHNTTLSAVAVIYGPSENDLSLDIYHNVHAKIKLRPEFINGPNVKHFTLKGKEPGELQDWVEM